MNSNHVPGKSAMATSGGAEADCLPGAACVTHVNLFCRSDQLKPEVDVLQIMNGFPSVSNRAGFYTTVWRNEEKNTASLAAGITATSRAMEWHVTYCMRTCFCGHGRAPSRLVDFAQRRPKTVRSLMETDRHRPHHVHRYIDPRSRVS